LTFGYPLIHVRWSGEACWISLGDLDLGLGYENATISRPRSRDLWPHARAFRIDRAGGAVARCATNPRQGGKPEMPDTPTFGRYAEIPYDQMTPEQQEGYNSPVVLVLPDNSREAQMAKAWVRPDRRFAAVSWSRRRGKTSRPSD
jgi:hypothetical protein